MRRNYVMIFNNMTLSTWNFFEKYLKICVKLNSFDFLQQFSSVFPTIACEAKNVTLFLMILVFFFCRFNILFDIIDNLLCKIIKLKR